jgi:hypothetical protein
LDVALSQFSDWTLALLPRLFLYPGGLWMLGALLWLSFVRGGFSARWRRGFISASPMLAAAVAWAALALIPLPGTSPMPVPVDRVALVGLLVTSLLVSVYTGDKLTLDGKLASAGLTLAALAPLASGRDLIANRTDWGLSGWVALVAILVGLFTLPAGLDADLRLLGWLGLGGAPMWALVEQTSNGILWVSLAYVLLLAALGVANRLLDFGGNEETRTPHSALRNWAAAMCLGLAGFSLLLELLG